MEFFRDSKGLRVVALGSFALSYGALCTGDVNEVNDYILALSLYSTIESQRLPKRIEGRGIVSLPKVAVPAQLNSHRSLPVFGLGRLLPVLLSAVCARHNLSGLTSPMVDQSLAVDPVPGLVVVSLAERLLLRLEIQR